MEKTRILIVEDNPVVALDLEIKLNELGYHVSATVYSGEKALKAAEENLPDLALMDINLGQGINGIETAMRLREKFDVPVIYITAHADDDTVSKAKITEPYGYIVKPFDPDQLRYILEIALHKLESDRKMKENRQWFQTTLESIGDGVITTDMEGRITFINPAAQKMTGWPGPDAVNRPLKEVFQIIDEHSEKPRRNPVEEVIKTGQLVRLAKYTLLISRNGKKIQITDTAAPIVMENGETVGVVLVFQDSSNMREQEKKLQQSEDRFKNLFDYAPLPYQSLDVEGRVIEVNRTWLDSLGYEKSEIIGKYFSDFLKPGWEENLKEHFPKIKTTGEVWGTQLELRRKDGSYIDAQFDGKILKNSDGEFVQTYCVFKDISVEKQLEEQVEKQGIALMQAHKMEAIGNLAGGIAHDFNNILASMMGFTELILLDAPKGTEIRSHLEEILRSGQRAKKLVKQILTFSRKEELEKKPIPINSVITEVVSLMRATTPSNIEIKTRTGPDSIVVNANATQMNQVIMNLVTNAVHAMDDNGIIEITSRQIHFDHSDVLQYPDLEAGEYVKISVSDTGCGIAGENIDAIFEPYYTTKTRGKGTGLGLAVVHGIIKLHHGHIHVQSEQGKGTTVNVYLPLADQPLIESATPAAHETARGSERILFVDDEPVIVRLQKRILERLGYLVTSTTNSLDALEKFRTNPDSFHLIITDATMPHMTGEKLCEAAKKIRPDIPVILCTGYSEKVSEETATKFSIDAFLMKPVEPDQLLNTIRKLLDK